MSSDHKEAIVVLDRYIRYIDKRCKFLKSVPDSEDYIKNLKQCGKEINSTIKLLLSEEEEE